MLVPPTHRRASGGNSGIACTGFDAPHDSLEFKLIRRSLPLLQEHLRTRGLPHQPVGSLVIARSQSEVHRLQGVRLWLCMCVQVGPRVRVGSTYLVADAPWPLGPNRRTPDIVAENHAVGDKDVRVLTREELTAAEPGLAPSVLAACWIPGEVSCVWLVAVVLAHKGTVPCSEGRTTPAHSPTHPRPPPARSLWTHGWWRRRTCSRPWGQACAR